MVRNLKNVSNEGAANAGWDIVIPFPSEVVGKAVYDREGLRIMKSTKRFKVVGGYIYNTSTEVDNNGSMSVAEALVFVPEK